MRLPAGRCWVGPSLRAEASFPELTELLAALSPGLAAAGLQELEDPLTAFVWSATESVVSARTAPYGESPDLRRGAARRRLELARTLLRPAAGSDGPAYAELLSTLEQALTRL